MNHKGVSSRIDDAFTENIDCGRGNILREWTFSIVNISLNFTWDEMDGMRRSKLKGRPYMKWKIKIWKKTYNM